MTPQISRVYCERYTIFVSFIFLVGLVICTLLSFKKCSAVPILRTYSKSELDNIQSAAEDGNMFYQKKLGFIYVDGTTVTETQGYSEFMATGEKVKITKIKKDPVLALKWLDKAAQQGDEDALLYMGRVFQLGEGVPKNIYKASVYFRQAAKQGSPRAQDLLGRLFRDGKGVEQDCRVAEHWFKQSALRQNLEGADDLSRMYLQGCKDFPPDYKKAYFWAFLPMRKSGFNHSTVAIQPDNGAPDTFVTGGETFSTAQIRRKKTVAHLTTKVRAELDQQIQEWQPPFLQHSSHLPDYKPMYFAGGSCTQASYALPKYVPYPVALTRFCGSTPPEKPEPDCKTALAEVQRGNIQAQLYLGWKYYYGDPLDRGCTQDKQKALDLIKSAAEQGSPEGQCSLSSLYDPASESLGTKALITEVLKPSYVQEYFWAKLAEKAGLGSVDIMLGGTDKLTPQQKEDTDKAVSAWRPRIDLKAAETGDAALQYWIGMLYNNGWGYPQDSGKAVKWFLRAANKGSRYAQFMLIHSFMKGDGTGQSYAKAYFWYMVLLKGDSHEVQDRTDWYQSMKYLSDMQMRKIRQQAFVWKPTD